MAFTRIDSMTSSTPSSTPSVQALFIGPTANQPLQPVDQVVAVAGHGLEGDRTYRRAGKPPSKNGPDREITLIEAEAIEAVSRDYDVALSPIETRRNVVTRGIALNHLVGKQFRVGAVVLRGIRLCEPGEHLESLTRVGLRGTGAPGRLAGPDPRGRCDPDRRPHRPDRSLTMNARLSWS